MKTSTVKKLNNPVAKNLRKANRASKHRDKKNDYTRKDKHKKNLTY